MTAALYRDDPYLKTCQAKVLQADADGVVLDRTVFFAASGGQAGDRGRLLCGEDEVEVSDTVHASGGIRHLAAAALPVGADVIASLDWERRHLLMRTHTALHLLCAAVGLPVTGGRVDAGSGRLDFDMPEPPDREAVAARLAEFVAADAPVRTRWIAAAELAERPELVRTLAAPPPADAAKVSLVEIEGIDLQACGGTHVRSTAEIGRVELGKVEKKGRRNRRFAIRLADG
ncbi:MAG: alanyl-tRNA editing protein [Betaproteobacteria bacterium AqS2]|uniref:Alanine--tRNA ligase n=1 Tax=Candidatus Amphirhobacter heronislandensis TaxID=1732024 RepID=A0A930UDM0_9GAMM|nr:alanyl-tRNA editing protein [Betaproteobacteria bacterium AqS2]